MDGVVLAVDAVKEDSIVLWCDFHSTVGTFGGCLRKLLKDYKLAIDHNKRSGVARKETPFKDKLDIILEDRPSAEPVQTF